MEQEPKVVTSKVSRWGWAGWMLWLAVLVGSWLVYRQYQQSPALLEDADIRREVEAMMQSWPEGAPGRLRVIHFLDPACPCTAFTLQHLQSLRPTLQALGVSAFLVSAGDAEAGAGMARVLEVAPWRESVPALRVAPAIAIGDDAGRLIYFGPYSLSMVCGEDNLLSEILARAARGEQPPEALSIETGCFCAWP